MDVSALKPEIQRALRRRGISAAAASQMATGNANLVKNIYDGHVPRVDSLARLAAVLDLEFFLGPPPPLPSKVAAALNLPADADVPAALAAIEKLHAEAAPELAREMVEMRRAIERLSASESS